MVEVLVSMSIVAVIVLAATAAFQWAERGRQEALVAMRALAMAESRLEAKRAAPWDALFTDDVDGDGRAEIMMRDDGMQSDAQGGDGTYSASLEEGGITLVWMVRPNRQGPLSDAGSALIAARATYTVGSGQERHIELSTLRANPNYIGNRR